MKRIILLGFLLSAMLVDAQINQSLRREFDLDDAISNYSVSLFGEQGLLVYGSELLSAHSARRWYIYKLNKEFQTVDSIKFDLPKQLNLRFTETQGDKLYLMFIASGSAFVRLSAEKESYHLSVVDFPTLKIRSFNGTLPRKGYATDMEICANKAYLAVSQKRARSLLSIDLIKGTMKQDLIKMNDSRNIWIEDIEVDTVYEQTFVYVGSYIRKKVTTMSVLIYNSKGERVQNYKLSSEKDHNLTDITVSQLSADHYLFTGTYSKQSASAAEGLFILEMKAGNRTFLRYYNFLDFENFLNYLPQRKQDRIERKKARRAKLGSELSYNFLIESHELLRHGDKYFYLGEAYYPTYRTESYQVYINGQWVTQYRQVFDGYQYTHAILASFDAEGSLVWDNTFEMWTNYKPFYPIRFITQSFSEDGRIDLFYSSRSSIYRKAFDLNGNQVADRSYSGIVTSGEDDVVRYSMSSMEHWYDEHFVAYGYQRIKDKAQKLGQKRRSVFFINKVTPE